MQQATSRMVQRVNRYEITDKQKSTISPPIFSDSLGTYGIQIADAIAYCTFKHKMMDTRFNRYWNVICDMLWRNNSDTLQGCGYKEYP